MTLREDLERLHDFLSRGWCQYGSGPNGVRARHGNTTAGCLSQQMAEAAQTTEVATREDYESSWLRYEAMHRALGFGDSFTGKSNLIRWNDDRDTTWQQVQDRVKDAIAKAPLE